VVAKPVNNGDPEEGLPTDRSGVAELPNRLRSCSAFTHQLFYRPPFSEPVRCAVGSIAHVFSRREARKRKLRGPAPERRALSELGVDLRRDLKAVTSVVLTINDAPG
jgi:hypothetical protein